MNKSLRKKKTFPCTHTTFNAQEPGGHAFTPCWRPTELARAFATATISLVFGPSEGGEDRSLPGQGLRFGPPDPTLLLRIQNK